jgi:hypothetical protein
MTSAPSFSIDIVIGAALQDCPQQSFCPRRHHVTIYEKSRFKNEIGAAIVLAPNATRVFGKWGFDFEAAGAVFNYQMRRFEADTLKLDSDVGYKTSRIDMVVRGCCCIEQISTMNYELCCKSLRERADRACLRNHFYRL